MIKINKKIHTIVLKNDEFWSFLSGFFSPVLSIYIRKGFKSFYKLKITLAASSDGKSRIFSSYFT